MDNFLAKFEHIKNSNDSEVINDFLIDLGKNPKTEYLNLIDFFINNREAEIFNKIKINLIYFLGQLGNRKPLDKKYIDFLSKEYFKSDRWIRNEIIDAFIKIGNNTRLSEKVFGLLKYAINDDYSPIACNAAKLLLNFDDIPDEMWGNLFKAMKIQDSELIHHISKVIKRNILNENSLFDKLSSLNNYKNFDKKSVRTVLIIFFNTVIHLKNLESLRELILKSKWENHYRDLFMNEIDTYEKILLKTY